MIRLADLDIGGDDAYELLEQIEKTMASIQKQYPDSYESNNEWKSLSSIREKAVELRSWDEDITAILKPGLEEATAKAEEEITSAVEIAITNALNPYRYSDLSGSALDNILETLFNGDTDWVALTKNVTTGDELRAYADQYVKNVVDAYKSTKESVVESLNELFALDVDFTSGENLQTAQDALSGAVEQLRSVMVPENEIEELLRDYYDKIGMVAKDVLKETVDTGTSDVVADEETESDFEQNIKTAKAYLDQVYALRDAIAKLRSDSSMTDTSILESLYKVFGKEDVDSW